MRRILSILLLVAFGLPGITPLFALSTSAGKDLPVCCRRAGMHHCMGSTDEAQGAGHRVSAPMERCPFCPSTVAGGTHTTLFPPAVKEASLSPASRPNGVAQAESMLRIARSRSRQKRGPPSFDLL